MSSYINLRFTNRSGHLIASVSIDARSAWLPKAGDAVDLVVWQITKRNPSPVIPDEGEDITTPVTVERASFEIYTTQSAGYSEVRYRVVLSTDWKPVT